MKPRSIRASRRACFTRFAGWAGAVLLGPAAQAQSPVVEVSIAAMQFQPTELRVAVGTTVRWVNREKRTSHSILFADQPESPRLLPDETWERRFERPGHYPYVCGPHPEMRGVVVVA